MRLRELGTALLVAFASVAFVLGSLSISLVEYIPADTPTPTFNFPASPIPVTATSTPLPTDPSLPTQPPTVTNTVPAPVICQPPTGWIPIAIQINDSLDSLALRYNVDKNQLRNANCLLSDNLISGTLLYVPPTLTSTFTVCSPGAVGWVKSYTVKTGDTLYAIATNHYTIVSLLQKVNCKFTDRIVAGEVLWVPNVSTRTPYPTPLPGDTALPYPTDPLTQTALPFTATVQPTNTSVPNTPTPIPTLTASPTPIP